MKTDSVAEDRIVSSWAIAHVYAATATDVIDEGSGETSVAGSASEDFEHRRFIDPARPRYSQEGMAVYEFAKSVWHINGVVAVTHAVDRNVNLVWTFIKERDKELRRSIYARERALMSQYPGLVFNFHVAALRGGASDSLTRDAESRIVLCRLE